LVRKNASFALKKLQIFQTIILAVDRRSCC